MRYKKTTKSLPEIAKELGVDAIVEGSVSRSGSQVKITAQLIDASKDKHLWARLLPARPEGRAWRFRARWPGRSRRRFESELTPEERTHLTASRPVDPEAYDAYLQGRYYWYRRTPEDALKARDYFEKAIAKDPEYALAYAGLADAYVAPRVERLQHAAAASRRRRSWRRPRERRSSSTRCSRRRMRCSRTSTPASRETFLRPNGNTGAPSSSIRSTRRGGSITRSCSSSRPIRRGHSGGQDRPGSRPAVARPEHERGFRASFAGRDDEAIEWCRRPSRWIRTSLRAR